MSAAATAGRWAVIIVLVGYALFLYVLFASWIGALLHRRDVERQFRDILAREAAYRLELIAASKRDIEASKPRPYLTNYADVITRENASIPRLVHQVNNSSDDADGFMLDTTDTQPTRPAA